MNELPSELLEFLCTGVGQGHTNTDKLTKLMLLANPGGVYNRTKVEVVEALKELEDSGQIQIVTVGWELGQEFLYICTNRL